MAKAQEGIFETNNLCKECSGNIITIHGTCVCRKCGLVRSERNLDLHNPPRRIFTMEEEKLLDKNAPRPSLFGNRTNIGRIKKDIKDKFLYRRMDRLNKSLASYERSLWITKRDLFSVFSHFKIPDHITEEVWRFYRKITYSGFLRGGSSRDLSFATTVYIMCRKYNYHLFIYELVDFFNLERSKFTHHLYKLFKRFNITMPPIDVKSYIIRLCSELNIEYQTELVEEMIEASNTLKAVNPKGIIGSIVYLLGLKSRKVSQVEVAELLNITEVTIRERKREITQNMGIIPLFNTL